MTRAWTIAAGGLLIVVLVAAGAFSLFLREEGSGIPPPVALSKVGSCSSPAPLMAGRWEVRPDGRSFVGYRVTEKFASLPTHTPAAGRTPLVAGFLVIQGSVVTSATVRADLRGLHSNRAGRDRYLHTHAIQSNLYPMATFVLTSALRLRSTPSVGRPVFLAAPGRLSVHGVTRMIIARLEAQRTCAGIEIIGRIPIKFADYAVIPPYVPGFAAVESTATIELRLEFRRG